MLERHELDAFLTLGEELHFGRTAERLHVSTTSVSQTIRKLERRVSAPLFNRTSRRVELTATGRRLHSDLKPAWAQITAAVQRATETARGMTGTLTAGFVEAAGGQLLHRIATLFQTRHPGCDVRIREAPLGDTLHDGFDVLLTEYPPEAPDTVTGGVLISEARMLAVPTGHPLAGRTSVTPGEAAQAGLLGGPGRQAATLQEMLTLVGAGKGVLPIGAHIRRYYTRPDVAYVVMDEAPPVEWGLVWQPARSGALITAFNQAALSLIHGA